jgi:hypothetical protein
MSLNRALTEMFKAVREEAARNPEFAAKIGEAMAIYKPPKRRRRLPAVVAAPSPAPAKPFDLQESLARPEPPEAKDFAAEVEDEVFAPPAADAPKINPITFITREGEDALRSELEGEAYSSEGLQRLVADHNLDPAGLAAGADKAGLIDQIIAQAKKRVARDKALFDY